MAPVLAALALIIVGLVAFIVVTRRRNLAAINRLAQHLGRDTMPLGNVVDGVDNLIGWNARVQETSEEQSSLLGQLGAALSAIDQGTVICDADGEEIFRDATAEGFASARHGDALVEAAIAGGLERARRGQTLDEEVELFGPPRRVLIVRCRPLLQAKTVIGAIAIVEDVSEVIRITEMRRDFIANVSHELKTPVGALSLLAETASDEPDPEVLRTLAARMHRESYRLGHIIDDLLDLSRIERDSSREYRSVSVAEVVSESISAVATVADEREIELVCSTPLDDAGPQVFGDQAQLISALQNLLENSIKYSDAESSIELRVGSSDDEVTIVVEDHGMGIPQTDQERVFERFYRVDRGRSRTTGGTGLGLSIVRNVAQNHGGSVSVVSREGEGSTFTLSLPREVERSEEAGGGGGQDGAETRTGRSAGEDHE